MFDLFLSFWFLLFLEIILGIDNIIFISLLSNQVPLHLRKKVRFLGLSLSLIFRLMILFYISVLLKMQTPLFYIKDIPISYRSIAVILGGLFLIAKATSALHQEVKSELIIKAETKSSLMITTMVGILYIILQIIVIDFVFSLDSLLTAIGLTNNLYIIAAVITGSIIFMMLFANIISVFIAKYKTLKTLALAFILMIGVFLLLDGFNIHINKGYLYFAMGFSLMIELLNNLAHSNKS